MDVDLNEIAEKLATVAVGGEKHALDIDMNALKQQFSTAMENPYIRNSLIGAGAGGLLGLATGGRRRWSDALHYGLLGGLGGAGLTAGQQLLTNNAPQPEAPKANPVGAGMRTTAQIGGTLAAPAAVVTGMGAAAKAAPRVGAAIARRSPALATVGSNMAAGAKALPGARAIGRGSRWGLPLAALYAGGQATGLNDRLLNWAFNSGGK